MLTLLLRLHLYILGEAIGVESFQDYNTLSWGGGPYWKYLRSLTLQMNFDEPFPVKDFQNNRPTLNLREPDTLGFTYNLVLYSYADGTVSDFSTVSEQGVSLTTAYYLEDEVNAIHQPPFSPQRLVLLIGMTTRNMIGSGIPLSWIELFQVHNSNMPSGFGMGAHCDGNGDASAGRSQGHEALAGLVR